MTPTLAAYIAQHFTVVTPIESGDSSFGATVWRANNGDGSPSADMVDAIWREAE